jgi:hypothetical protein
MDPSRRAIEQHDSNSGPEETKYLARLTPVRSQDDPDYIVADKSKVGADGHAYECEHPKRTDEVSPEPKLVLVQSTEGCQSNVVKGRDKFTLREHKEVVRPFVEAQSHGVESPPNQQVVNVLRRIFETE